MNQNLILQPTRTPKTPLYRHVFYGRFSLVVVFLLLCSILLQPIDRVRAEVDAIADVPVPIDTSAVSGGTVPTTEAEILLPATGVGEDVVTEATTTIEVESNTIEVLTATASTVAETIDATTETDASNTVASQDERTESDLVTLRATTSDSTATTTESSVATTTNPADVVSVGGSESVAVITTTSTPEIVALASTTGEIKELSATVSSDSQIQFDKSDCVAVADGSYYCKTKAPNTEHEVKDGLYSKPDADGDMEIYFGHNGTLEQISYNQVDDASPNFDSISDTIVWHRLINDRYQIISYDVKSGSESQLTTDTVNNMEPARAGKFTAWQHWNNDNWDIMLYDGATTKLLTSVPEHDIAPKIHGNLVLWNRMSRENSQTIELYDLTTGEYTSIADDEGGELSNPRMVLVYDAQFGNGDVVTKGYDVDSGKITPLTAIPVKVPDSIPPPETTGETRALLQIKNTSREEGEQSTTTTPTIDPPRPPDNATTTVTALTLDLQAIASTTVSSSTTTATFILDLSIPSTSIPLLSENDVVVPAFVSTTVSTTTP
jgi:hypothetical protein